MRPVLHSLVLLVLSAMSASAVVLLDDSWADGTRSDTALSAESAWFSSNAASLNAAVGSLTGTAAPCQQWEATLPANPGPRLFLRLDLTTPAP